MVSPGLVCIGNSSTGFEAGPSLGALRVVLFVPLTPLNAIDICGEYNGSFSYLFSLSSNRAPLAHIKIAMTGLADVPDVQQQLAAVRADVLSYRG